MFSHNKVLLSYTECNEWPLTFDYTCQQKLFFDIQWCKEKTLKHFTFKTIVIQSKLM